MAQSAPAYCSLLAQAEGFDPIGTASPYDELILIELPLPWAYRVWESPHLPADLTEFLLETAKARAYRLRVLFIAPDTEYCRPGLVRVIYLRRPEGLLTRFTRIEFALPAAEMPALVRGLCLHPANLAAWEGYRQAVDDVRDLMVCTHGTVDVVCGKFGYPTYQMLRTHYANATLRVWRVSHFGGHICAPTLLSLPDGRAWAYITADHARQLVLHAGTPQELYANYRGWAALPAPFAQVVERAVWMREGWGWLGCAVDAAVVAQDTPPEGTKPQWAEVVLHYVRGDGRRGRYCGRVEVCRTLELMGSTKNDHLNVYSQYEVVSLVHEPEPAGICEPGGAVLAALPPERIYA